MADRFDLDAIDADDALLDLLAAGGELARTAGEHDPAVKLLAELRLAVEVEDELPVETIDDPESFLARCAALNPMTDPLARKMAARGLALGVAAVAALSVSGVAAAVTGDPLSPYEKVIEKMVDAVTPQTSFPKEQLDGMPVLDKTKIVKVGKDYQKAQEQKVAADDGNVDSVATDPVPPAAVIPQETPDVLQRAMPQLVEQPTATQVEPSIPETTTAPDTTSGQTTDTTTPPADTTTPPADTTTPPATDTTTPPTDTTTTPPADTTTPPPTDTTTPTDSNAPGGGNGKGNGEANGKPTTAPDSDSTGSTGETQPGTDSTTGTSTGTTGSDPAATDPAGGTLQNPPLLDIPPVTISLDTPAVAATPPAADTAAASPSTDTPPAATPSTDTPATDSPATGAPADPVAEVAEVVDTVIDTILPPSNGEHAEKKARSNGKHSGGKQATEKSSAKKSHGKHAAKKQSAGKSHGKHSSGKVSTGSVRKDYAKGKHSSGHYAEGKHAAIDRTHGSTDDANVLKILGLVNKPTK